jgi:hypothetical protein
MKAPPSRSGNLVRGQPQEPNQERKPAMKTKRGIRQPVKQPQPQWNYKPLPKRHSILMPLVLLVAASTAFGELGDTQAVMYPRLKPQSVMEMPDDTTRVLWSGKTVRHCVRFRKGKSIYESIQFTDERQMSGKDIIRFLKPYADKKLELNRVEYGATWQFAWALTAADGSRYGIVTYNPAGAMLTVWQVDYFMANYIPDEAPQPQPELEWL